MIKGDELREFRPQVCYQNGDGITLSTVQKAIKDCAMQMNIPVAFKNDQVKSGGFFNSSIEDCIVMYHPEHEKDYFKFCIRVKRQGNYVFVMVNDFGQSKQIKKANEDEILKDISTPYRVVSAVGKGLFGKNSRKLEEENMYYHCVFDIFDQIG